MSASPSPRRLERLAYAEGTRLLVRDFTRRQEYEPGLLAAHLRCAHMTWGIAEGLEIEIQPGQGAVEVGAGIAWNCLGEPLELRDAVLSKHPIAIAADLASEAFDLVLRTPARPSPCAPIEVGCDGAPIPPPGPELEWISVGAGVSAPPYPAGSERLGLDLPLVRAIVAFDGSVVDWRFSERRHVHPRPGARLRGGRVGAGDLKWRVDGDGVLATVRTGDAGFVSTPTYVAWPEVDVSTLPIDVPGLVPLLQITHAWPEWFEVRLGLGGIDVSTLPPGRFTPFLTIAWLGAEPTLCCPEPVASPPPPFENPIS